MVPENFANQPYSEIRSRLQNRFIPLSQYLSEIDLIVEEEDQKAWYEKLKTKTEFGSRLFEKSPEAVQQKILESFNKLVRTEELKAWYGSPEGDSLFQGTSISSLTIPAVMKEPLHLHSIIDLEESMADEYIALHDRHQETVKNAISENVDGWLQEGLYYGLVVASKLISQAFALHIPQNDVICEVDGRMVDPHEISSYPMEIREKYFSTCRSKVNCFSGLNITQSEFELSLVTADISKPKISAYQDQLILGPVRCNEICTLLSRHVTNLVRKKTQGRISPRSLMVTIYDTDTPYTYHQLSGYQGCDLSPALPGLIVQGTSGTMDAFRWLYSYRVSLVAQKMMKGSLYSETCKEYTPFVFFGVLVPRDADILLGMDDLGKLRYRGNLSPALEFSYLMPKLLQSVQSPESFDMMEEIASRIR